MQKWEITMVTTRNVEERWTFSGRGFEAIWKIKYKDGTTDFDTIAEAASEGWELVCVTPRIQEGTTKELLLSFKRPKE